jgi:hypothetical protein
MKTYNLWEVLKLTNSALYDILVNYIEDNKTNYNIDYKETIETIEELIEEIKKDYEDLKEEK